MGGESPVEALREIVSDGVAAGRWATATEGAGELTREVLDEAGQRLIHAEVARPIEWPRIEDLTCGWCWEPLVGHGRRHSLVGRARRRAAQIRYDLGRLVGRIRG